VAQTLKATAHRPAAVQAHPVRQAPLHPARLAAHPHPHPHPHPVAV
jgi:hypothetical protein